MPNFNSYFGDSGAIDAAGRAVDAWNRISRDSESIVIVRDGVALVGQTVRVEFAGVGEDAASSAGRVGRQRCVVFGVSEHPTIADTDIQRGDRFALNSKQFEVIAVINPPGDVQAYCEAIR